MKPSAIASVRALLAGGALGLSGGAGAQTSYQWNGTTGSSWPAGANWQGGTVGATGGTFNARLNVYNGAASPLIYSATQGTTVYANTTGRGLVISFAGGSLNGSMEITGGSFSTLGSTQADVIGNAQNGTLTISGNGSFTGAASFAGGAVGSTAGGTMVGLNSSGGTSILNIRDSGSATLSTLYLAAATATVNLDGGTLTANQVVDVDNSGAPGNSNTTFNFNGGILRAGSGAATAFLGGLGAAYVRAGGARIDTNGKDVTIAQALLDFTTPSGGGLTKSGDGTLTLSNSNTYTGPTVVSAGTLLIAGGSLAPASPLSVASGATFQSNVNNTWGANSVSIGSWTIAGTFRTNSNGNAQTMPTNVTLNGGTMANNGLDYAVYGNFLNSGGTTITANGAGNSIAARVGMFSGLTVHAPLAGDELTVSGVLGAGLAGGNSGGLTKTGAGTLTLSNNSTTYTGATTVTQGTLLINGNITSSTLTTVKTGAVLGGSGSVGALTIEAGGTLAPGNSPGILNTGNYNQAGTLSLELNGTTAGSGYDQVNVTGSVTLGGILAATVGYTPANNQLLFILLNDGNDAISGTFSGLAQGGLVTFNGFDWQISYTADSTGNTFNGGNDVALRAVPEPTAALLGGLGLLALLRRRRE